MDELADYDYELPPELVATAPLAQRDAARMLVVDRRSRSIAHRRVRELPDLLDSGDCLVVNDTQVVPARLFGRRVQTGGKWEGLFLRVLPLGEWLIIGHSGGKLRAGEEIAVAPTHGDAAAEFRIKLIESDPDGIWRAQPLSDASAVELLNRFGTVPLPPYIGRNVGEDVDRLRYQTIYARQPGAVAAPTAGLHFTPDLFARCAARGIEREVVTLHVGLGTFRPIAGDSLDRHEMHREWCEIAPEACEHLNRVRAEGGRIVAVGTTTVRTLETAAAAATFQACSGDTGIFIRPPHHFLGVDALLTNFHLPRSTLLVLVSAFGGTELIRQAYAAAIAERYRFYSYGDAMLIV